MNYLPIVLISGLTNSGHNPLFYPDLTPESRDPGERNQLYASQVHPVRVSYRYGVLYFQVGDLCRHDNSLFKNFLVQERVKRPE